jgi:HSP20 family protein
MALIRRTENKQSPAPSPVRDAFQIMDELMRWDPFTDFGLRSSLFHGESFAPAFDVRETKHGYELSADLPGMTEDALELSLSGNRLTISGQRHEERREEGDRLHMYERRYGAFSRSFTLPEGVDKDKIEAQLANGVLQVTVPKKPEHKPRRISLRRLLGSDSKAGKANEESKNEAA